MSIEDEIVEIEALLRNNTPSSEYPMKFAAWSPEGLKSWKDQLVERAREEGPNGDISKEERERAREAYLHAAGHMQIEMAHAMEYHRDFIENGMFGRERLETFSSMLENDDYWDYLNDPKNKEEREKVRSQHFDGMIDAIEKKERSVLDMSPRESALQGVENMNRLQKRELEVLLKDAPPEQHEQITNDFNDAVEAKFGRFEDKSSEDLNIAYEASVKLEGGEESIAGKTDQPEVSQAVAAEIESGVDDVFAAMDFENFEIPDDVKLVASQNPVTVKAFRDSGIHEQSEAAEKTATVAEAAESLSKSIKTGVEETGKSEPDKLVVENASPEESGQSVNGRA